MKTLSHVPRILLGLVFAVSGANGFLHFIPLPPPPEGPAGQFMSAMFVSGFFVPVYGLQLVGGVLLLANRFVPVALAVLAPIVVNIVLYHVFMAPHGTAMAIVTLVLLAWLFRRERVAFAGILGKARLPDGSSDARAGRANVCRAGRASATRAVRGRRGTLLAKDLHELL